MVDRDSKFTEIQNSQSEFESKPGCDCICCGCEGLCNCECCCAVMEKVCGEVR